MRSAPSTEWAHSTGHEKLGIKHRFENDAAKMNDKSLEIRHRINQMRCTIELSQLHATPNKDIVDSWTRWH